MRVVFCRRDTSEEIARKYYADGRFRSRYSHWRRRRVELVLEDSLSSSRGHGWWAGSMSIEWLCHELSILLRNVQGYP